jgi:hypothetical protein
VNNRQDAGEEGLDCGGVCAKVCLPQDLKPLEVVGVIVRRPAPGFVTIVGKVQNPNGALAVREMSYQFEFYDAEGKAVRTSPSRSMFLYAGEVRYVPLYEADGAIPEGGAVDLVLGEPTWAKASEFQRPDVAVVERTVQAAESGLTVVGRITHRDTVRIPRATVIALFYDPAGRSPLGVSETTLTGLLPGETREFAIVHPPIEGYDPARLELVVVPERP